VTGPPEGRLVHQSERFTISYATAGPGAVAPDTSTGDVIDPGSDPPVRLATLPDGGAPRYVRLVAFWLERALDTYTAAPLSMRDPTASGGKIPVTIGAYPGGGADRVRGIMLSSAWPDELIAECAVHETFHMVQYEYARPGPLGPWFFSLLEGGADFAEGAVLPALRRHLYTACAGGILTAPGQSLITARYNAALFWRYLAEQHAADASSGLPGAGAFRCVVEHAFAGTFSTEDIVAAVRALPPLPALFEFSYLDAGRRHLLTSETLLGNFALACYLHGSGSPDRRFGFRESGAPIPLFQLLHGARPRPLAPVTLAGRTTLAPASPPIVFEGAVEPFAHQFYEISIGPAVDAIDVLFHADPGPTSPIFQVVLVGETGGVRDIHRTDATTYRKRIASARGGRRLSRLALVVSGADGPGSFSLAVAPAAPGPDVMITRWNSAETTEYETGARRPDWSSADLWIEGPGARVPGHEALAGAANALRVRLHNQGAAEAAGIAVELAYQQVTRREANGGGGPAAPALEPGAPWLPLKDGRGRVQSLSSLSLPAGTSRRWTVTWCPTADLAGRRILVRATVAAAGDVNTDNKTALSVFECVSVPETARAGAGGACTGRP
jgi:hypothetical protein